MLVCPFKFELTEKALYINITDQTVKIIEIISTGRLHLC